MLQGLSEKRMIALDWDDREVRVVHAAYKKGRCRVLSVQSFLVPDDVSPGDTDAFGKLIREFLAREKISTRTALMHVPRSQATVKRLRKLPPANPDDLPGVIAMQFARELAFPATEAAIDFAEPRQDEGGLAALVAAVQKDVLENYAAICKVAGLKLERVCLRPNANRIALNAVLESGGHERVLFVDVGSSFTEIDVMAGGELAFTRAASVHVPADLSTEPPPPPAAPSSSIALDLDQPVRLSGTLGGGRGASDMAQAVNTLVVEVVRSIEAFRTEDPGAVINHVVVGGCTGLEDALSEALRDRFEMTSELFNPSVFFGWDAERGVEASGFAAALGLAMGHADESQIHPDFLNPRKVVTAAEKQLRKLPLVIGVAAALIAVMIGVWLVFVHPQQQVLAGLEDQIEQAKEDASARKQLRNLIKYVESVEADQVVWLDEVYDVLGCLPGNEDLVLESIDMRQKDRQIQLKVKATTRDILTDAVAALQALPVTGDRNGHYEAELRGTRTISGRYPVSGRMDIKIVGRREGPELVLRPLEPIEDEPAPEENGEEFGDANEPDPDDASD